MGKCEVKKSIDHLILFGMMCHPSHHEQVIFIFHFSLFRFSLFHFSLFTLKELRLFADDLGEEEVGKT